ncbi:MAG: hypothetical protein ACK478_06425, partial [Flavobacteriales bacterium]
CQNSAAPALPATSQEGITGTWSPNTITTTADGTFTFNFTPNDPTQCAIPTTIDVTINALPVIVVNSETICSGDDFATLVASGAVTYSWSPATDLDTTVGDTVIASPDNTGATQITVTYTVTGTDANGCENTATSTVTVNPTPQTSPIFHN